MAFVLDASMTMKWCFEDEAGPDSEAVLQRLRDNEEAYVPPVWVLDVANVLLVAERRGRLARSASSRFLQVLSELPIRIENGIQIGEISSIVSLASDHSLSSYDASYLRLAMMTGFPLASADERLRNAANVAGIRLIS